MKEISLNYLAGSVNLKTNPLLKTVARSHCIISEILTEIDPLTVKDNALK
jgi:hypothetical protein